MIRVKFSVDYGLPWGIIGKIANALFLGRMNQKNAESEAAYKSAKEMAKQAYDARLKEATRMRSEALERAKSEHDKTMEQAWIIFARATGQRVEG